MFSNRILQALTALSLLATTPFAFGQETAPRRTPWRVRVEGGAFWQSRNDVAVPGDTGTRFSLSDLTGSGPSPIVRLGLDWDVTERNGLRFTYAPIRTDGTGTLGQPTDFNGTTFAPGDATGRYQFDTYRLTWRYRFWHDDRWTWRAGLTGLLRDASIELEQGGISSTKSNTGFVPLLHVDGEWRFAPRWNLVADLDAAAASQGRAIDLLVEAGYDISDTWRVSAGYRGIEGGADNDEVYSFAFIHSAIVAVTARF